MVHRTSCALHHKLSFCIHKLSSMTPQVVLDVTISCLPNPKAHSNPNDRVGQFLGANLFVSECLR